MKKRLGGMFMKLGDYFLNIGYDLWLENTTEEEKVAFINSRLQPLGLRISKPDEYLGEYPKYDN